MFSSIKKVSKFVQLYVKARKNQTALVSVVVKVNMLGSKDSTSSAEDPSAVDINYDRNIGASLVLIPNQAPPRYVHECQEQECSHTWMIYSLQTDVK